MNISNLSAAQLRRAATLKTKIESLQDELNRLIGTSSPAESKADRPTRKRKLSAAGRARIAAAARARWARERAAKK